jgi:hypothetical protein
VPVPRARFSEGGERGSVQPVIALGVELDSVTTGQQKWTGVGRLSLRGFRRVAIVDGLSHVIEGLSQAPSRLLAGVMGPQ